MDASHLTQYREGDMSGIAKIKEVARRLGFARVPAGEVPLTVKMSGGRVVPNVGGVAFDLSLTSAAVGAFIAKLRTGLLPACMTLLSDSTGNEWGVEWFPKLGERIAQKYPAYTLTHRQWNDVKQAYDAPIYPYIGTAGLRYLTAGASRGSQLSIADNAATSLTGDQAHLYLIGLDAFPPATLIDVAGKSGAAGQRGIYLSIGTDGKMTLTWSVDGTATLAKTSTVAIPPNTDGSLPWIGWSLDVDNGASGNDVKFWTSADGITLTQLGATVTTAGTTSVFDNTASMIFGGRTGQFWAANVQGRLYACRVYADATFTVPVCDLDMGMASGYGSALVAPFTSKVQDAAGQTWTATTTSGAFVGSPEITMMNGAWSGQVIAYALDNTRQPKLTPKESDLLFINYGHNEGKTRTPAAFAADYKTLSNAVIARWPYVGIVANLQNPETAAKTQIYIDTHAMRWPAIRALAAAQGYAVIDAYSAFMADQRGLDALVNVGDGTHPTPAAGSPLWLETAWSIFAPW
jgi:hypothetical protein